jgi:hypothetical protein
MHKVNVKLSQCLIKRLNTASWRHMGKWRYGSTIDDLGTTWVLVVSLTPLTPNHLGNSPRYPLDRRLDAPQSRSGLYGEEEKLSPAGNRTSAAQPVARRCTDWAIRAPVLIGIFIVTWRVHPLLGSDPVKTFQGELTSARIGRPLLDNE